jgi:hypothetical protein
MGKHFEIHFDRQEFEDGLTPEQFADWTNQTVLIEEDLNPDELGAFFGQVHVTSKSVRFRCAFVENKYAVKIQSILEKRQADKEKENANNNL